MRRLAHLLVLALACAAAGPAPAGQPVASGRITWASWGGNGTVDRWFTVRGDGSGYRELPTPPKWFGGSTAVSPDGRLVAGSSLEGVWRAKINGSSKRTIVRIRGVRAVSWSPSGETIAFVRNFDDNNQVRTPRRDIYVVGADGRGRRHVATAYGFTDEPASWSTGGRRILFSSKPRYTAAVGTMYAVDVTSGARSALGKGDAPSYSPDGKHIAFLLKKTYQSIGSIFIADARGTGRRSLDAETWTRPVWSPDGTALVGSAYMGPGGLFVTHVDGTKQPIAPLLGDIIWIQWTR